MKEKGEEYKVYNIYIRGVNCELQINLNNYYKVNKCIKQYYKKLIYL